MKKHIILLILLFPIWAYPQQIDTIVFNCKKAIQARDIIKKTIDNAPGNNPIYLNSYSYNSYNRSNIELFSPEAENADHDSTYQFLSAISKKQYLFLMESISKFSFRQPNYLKEKVMASRVSGLVNPLYTMIFSQMLAASFYETSFELFFVRYVSPLAKGTFNRYSFQVIEEKIENSDTLYSIYFEPFYNARFNGLKGIMIIGTPNYGLKSVYAEPVSIKEGFQKSEYYKWLKDCDTLNKATPKKKSKFWNTIKEMNIASEKIIITDTLYSEWINRFAKFLQWDTWKYLVSPSDIQTHFFFSKHYKEAFNYDFPDSISFVYDLLLNRKYNTKLRLTTQSKINNITVNKSFQSLSFLNPNFEISPFATIAKQALWEQYRTLSIKEMNTYHVLDTLVNNKKVDLHIDWIWALTSGYVRLGLFDIDLAKVWTTNQHEKNRFGMGLYSNHRLLNWISFGGYAGYGVRDYVWKYGGEINLYPDPYHNYRFTFSYKKDLFTSANTDFIPKKIFDFNNDLYFLNYRFEAMQNLGFEVSLPLFLYTRLSVSFDDKKLKSLYNYRYFKNDEWTNEYHYTTTTFKLTVNVGEQVLKIPDFKQITTSPNINYPIFNLIFTGGLPIASDNYSFSRFQISYEQGYDMFQNGILRWYMSAGYVNKGVPYNLLFRVPGANLSHFYFIRSFNTVGVYEFITNRYISGYITYDTGPIFWRNTFSEPVLRFSLNSFWGDLETNPYSDMSALPYKVPQNGLFEIGTMLNKIVRIGSTGFGLGCFYRFGYYHQPNFWDNFTILWTLNFFLFNNE